MGVEIESPALTTYEEIRSVTRVSEIADARRLGVRAEVHLSVKELELLRIFEYHVFVRPGISEINHVE